MLAILKLAKMLLLTKLRQDLISQFSLCICRQLPTDILLMHVSLSLQRVCMLMCSKSAAAQDCAPSKTEGEKNNVQKISSNSEEQKLPLNCVNERRSISDAVQVLLNKHRRELARTVAKARGSYILDCTVASRIVQHLGIRIGAPDEIMFEANPGPGIVTQALLNTGIPILRVFEKRKVFLPYLQNLQSQYNPRLEIVEDNFLDLSKIESRHSHSFDSTADSVFRGVPSAKWTDAPPLKIFAILPKTNELLFLRFILAKLPRFQSLFSFGRTQLFLFVSGKEYLSLTARPNDKFVAYRSASVLFQIFFDITLLHKEPKESFYPPETVTCKKQQKYDCSHMYLISLTPKRELLDVVSPNLITELTFFIRQHLMKRRRLICQSLEQWIPGCTNRLVEKGLTTSTIFGELAPDQILDLFLSFSSWAEYPDSVFRTAARREGDHFHFNWTAADIKEAEEEAKVEEHNLLLR